MITRTLRPVAVIVSMVFLLAAALTAARPASAQPSAPTVTLSPAATGGVVNAMTITFLVGWGSGWDGSALGPDLSGTSGHVHFMVDGNPPAMHFADAGVTSTERSFSFDLGSHSVAVELVNPNHMPYDPAALSQASFEVTLTEEGRLILEQVQSVSGSLGTLATLLYMVLALAVVSIVVGAVAIGQVRSLRKRSAP